MAGARWFQSMYFLLKLGIFQLVMLIFQGGGFKYWFIFNPIWEMIQFDEHNFHMGWFNHNHTTWAACLLLA